MQRIAVFPHIARANHLRKWVLVQEEINRGMESNKAVLVRAPNRVRVALVMAVPIPLQIQTLRLLLLLSCNFTEAAATMKMCNFVDSVTFFCALFPQVDGISQTNCHIV